MERLPSRQEPWPRLDAYLSLDGFGAEGGFSSRRTDRGTRAIQPVSLSGAQPKASASPNPEARPEGRSGALGKPGSAVAEYPWLTPTDRSSLHADCTSVALARCHTGWPWISNIG
jgi:hypothetical protein